MAYDAGSPVVEQGAGVAPATAAHWGRWFLLRIMAPWRGVGDGLELYKMALLATVLRRHAPAAAAPADPIDLANRIAALPDAHLLDPGTKDRLLVAAQCNQAPCLLGPRLHSPKTFGAHVAEAVTPPTLLLAIVLPVVVLATASGIFWPWRGLFVASYVAGLVIAPSLLKPFTPSEERPLRSLVLPVAARVVGVTAAAIALVEFDASVNRPSVPGPLFAMLDTIAAGLVSVAFVIVVGLVFQYLTVIVVFPFLCRVHQARGHRHPDIAAADGLVCILEQLGLVPDNGWEELRTRQRILVGLEDVAQAVERLSRRLRGGDPATDRWARQRNVEVAASIRSLKRWVVVPKSDTRPFLVQEIADRLDAILTGDWDRLPRCAPEVLSTRERVRGLRPSAVLLAAVAVAPLTFVVVKAMTGTHPAEMLPVLVIALSWAGLFFPTSLNPKVFDRIKGLTEALGGTSVLGGK